MQDANLLYVRTMKAYEASQQGRFKNEIIGD
jgi:hypothetical protein